MRERLKEKLCSDEHCIYFLRKFNEKGLTFDELWSSKMYSPLLNAIRSKKGYYVRRVKESLWSTFGVNRIKPFKDNYSKHQMKEWKQNKNVRQVYNELYSPNDPEDPESDTYIALIIKSVFTAEKERTKLNGVWVQSVLESIFDEKHLSTKIDSDVVENWTEVITDTEMETDVDSPVYSPAAVVDDDNNNCMSMSLDDVNLLGDNNMYNI